MDDNIRFYDWILTRDRLEAFHLRALKQMASPDFPKSEAEMSGLQVGLLSQYGPSIVASIDKAKQMIRHPSEGFGPNEYWHSWSIINLGLQIVSLAFYPSRLTTTSFWPGCGLDSISAILHATEDRSINPFIDFVEAISVRDIIGSDAGLVGISVTSSDQVLAALTIARRLKAAGSQAHIVLGGNFVTRLATALSYRDEIFGDFVDSLIIGEGEQTLAALAQALEAKADSAHHPNIVRSEAQVVNTATSHTTSIRQLPPPRFDGLPLHLYLSAQPVALPILSARGCYWRKCAFCTISNSWASAYRAKPVAQVVEEVANMQQLWGSDLFTFEDESMSPIRAVQLAKGIVSARIKVYWSTAARLEPEFTEDNCYELFRGGCRALAFGLESASDQVLQKMGKGINAAVASNVLRHTARSGIRNHIFLIFGFPGAKLSDELITERFVQEHSEYLHSIAAGAFNLEVNSQIHRQPEHFGIKSIMPLAEDSLGLSCRYEVSDGLSPKEAALYCDGFLQRLPTNLQRPIRFPITHILAEARRSISS